MKQMMKPITKFNFIIDILLFLVMAAIGGIGLLLKYRLVSGEERWDIYGSNPELYIWGIDRHLWGDIHLYLGYFFFVLLFFHILLHWRQIKGIFQLMFPVRIWQVVLVPGLVIISVFLLFFGFFSPIDVDPLHPGSGRGRLDAARHLEEGVRPLVQLQDPAFEQGGEGSAEPGSVVPETAEGDVEESPGDMDENPVSLREPGTGRQALQHREDEVHQERTLEIYGTSTISEIEARFGIPTAKIKESLGISSDVPDSERLGRLRRRYGFHMSDVERLVLEYQHVNQ